MEKFTVKDLINVGVFGALYFIVWFLASFLGFVPITIVLIPAICAVIAGIPLMLFFSKCHTFGMVTILSTLLGLYLVLTGRPWISLIIAIAAGLLTDLIMKSKDYKSTKMAVLGSGTFSLWMMGLCLPMFFGFRDSYFASVAAGYGAEYADALMALTPDWMFFMLIILSFAGGIIGGLLGLAVLKKHFRKAGMA